MKSGRDGVALQDVHPEHGITISFLRRLLNKSPLILSGTLAHNKWHNLSGYIDFLNGHPFNPHKKFIETYGGSPMKTEKPSIDRVRVFFTAPRCHCCDANKNLNLTLGALKAYSRDRSTLIFHCVKASGCSQLE